jgi:hypothetical protein
VLASGHQQLLALCAVHGGSESVMASDDTQTALFPYCKKTENFDSFELHQIPILRQRNFVFTLVFTAQVHNTQRLPITE